MSNSENPVAWRKLYWAVLAFLILQLLVFYVITQYYAV